MFLRAKSRLKDGKVHRYWSIVENRRTQGNRIVQRQVLYLGEINDNQQAAWCKTIEVLQEGQAQPQAVAIFPEDRIAPALGGEIVSIKPSRTAATPSSAMGRLLAGLSTVGFEVLLYDLSRTYFESDPAEEGNRKFGYSRDERPDCVQMVIALIVTPASFPLAYEIMAGNTSDKTTLADFLIENREAIR